MESSAELRRLFKYDVWANERVFQALKGQEHFDGIEKSISYFAHIVASQESWLDRITQKSADGIELWPDYGLVRARKKLQTYAPKWQSLIEDRSSDIHQNISYANSKGVAYDTPLSDILHHLVIHGQHHRAQIALMLREEDIAPPATDFIAFVRAQ